jgi:energy-coupling factor transporter ATP-binding protein EcfA2
LTQLRQSLAGVRLTIPLPNADAYRTWASAAVAQLSDYILPRLATIEAPLLTVVGGSTGAGKSTLVNSLLGQVLTTPGVIRPTTKAPVLVHNPEDEKWFNNDRILPTLARSTESSVNPRSLQIIGSYALPPGLALLDAPDIDSVDVDNRTLAAQLLAAADLWLFITSAARYADAVPWDYLTRAAGRGAAVAVVVDRVPPAAMSAVPPHLARMMTERGLGDSPLFAVPETVTDERGLLPPAAVEPIKVWLLDLASSKVTRARVVMKTLDGAVGALVTGVMQLADQVDAQNNALSRLRADADTIFAEVVRSVRNQSSDGTLLRGEVMARWQDFVGTGEFMRSVETRVGRLRDRIGRIFTGETDRAADVKVAVKSGLESLVIEAGQSAAERVEASWLADPAGRFLVQWAGADISMVPPDFPARVEQAIRLWQQDVMELVSQEGANKRIKARFAALGVNAVGVALMIVAFAHTGGLAGAEIGIAGGTAVVAQKVLELVFGDDAIRRLAARTEEFLSARVTEVLESEHQRILALTLDRFPPESTDAAGLRALAGEVAAQQLEEASRLDTLSSDIDQDLTSAMLEAGEDATDSDGAVEQDGTPPQETQPAVPSETDSVVPSETDSAVPSETDSEVSHGA